MLFITDNGRQNLSLKPIDRLLSVEIKDGYRSKKSENMYTEKGSHFLTVPPVNRTVP